MRRRLSIAAVLLLLLPCLPARSQGTWVSKDYDFAVYLIDNDLKRDAAKLLSGSYNPSDTLTWLRGWTAYQLKQLDTALPILKSVTLSKERRMSSNKDSQPSSWGAWLQMPRKTFSG